MTSTFIPPLAVSRIWGSYHFEGGGYVAIVGDGSVPAVDMLDKAQALIDLKRGELAAMQAAPTSREECLERATEATKAAGVTLHPRLVATTQPAPPAAS